MVRNGLLAALLFGLSTTGAVAQEVASGEVARAQFTTGVVDREPIDALNQLGTETKTVYFFTELLGLEGREVTHRWEHNGELKAEVNFSVNGPRWRVWSSKELIPEWEGSWEVSVMSGGQVLRSESFTYGGMDTTADVNATVEAEATAEEEPEASAGAETTGTEGVGDVEATESEAPVDAAVATDSPDTEGEQQDLLSQ